MTTIENLIDKAAGMCKPQNDSALAARMHVSRSAVSLWRKGGAISEKHLTALITLADVDAATAIAVLEAQAQTKPQKAVWGELARRLAATAMGIGIVVLASYVGGPEGVQSALLPLFATAQGIHYAKSLIRAAARATALALALDHLSATITAPIR